MSETHKQSGVAYVPGLYWHVHHEGDLVEFCYSYQERADFIRTHKKKEEQETRLRLLQPVRGPLPKAVAQALQALEKARQAYDEARQAYDEAEQAYDEAEQALEKAWHVHDKARPALDKVLRENRPALEALHATECLDCPWDGETIFPATA